MLVVITATFGVSVEAEVLNLMSKAELQIQLFNFEQTQSDCAN